MRFSCGSRLRIQLILTLLLGMYKFDNRLHSGGGWGWGVQNISNTFPFIDGDC